MTILAVLNKDKVRAVRLVLINQQIGPHLTGGSGNQRSERLNKCHGSSSSWEFWGGWSNSPKYRNSRSHKRFLQNQTTPSLSVTTKHYVWSFKRRKIFPLRFLQRYSYKEYFSLVNRKTKTIPYEDKSLQGRIIYLLTSFPIFSLSFHYFQLFQNWPERILFHHLLIGHKINKGEVKLSIHNASFHDTHGKENYVSNVNVEEDKGQEYTSKGIFPLKKNRDSRRHFWLFFFHWK